MCTGCTTCNTMVPWTHRSPHSKRLSAVFGRPFVKRFSLCHRSVVMSACPVCHVGVLWPNDWMDQDETWHASRPRPWPHCIRWGSSFPPQRGTHPNFSTHICCDKMAGWIKMPPGTKVGLGPGDFVLDGDPAPPPLLWSNGWMD